VTPLIVMGASTGGPAALREIFTGMPRLHAAILLVQHMPAFINRSVVATLARISELDVVLAEDGETLAPGRLVVAPSGRHMTLEAGRTIRLADGEPVQFVCPSVDVLMRSLSGASGTALTGIVLTGMGSDGADGLAHMKALGAETIVQNEASCAVFGMPKRAIERGGVDRILEPRQIAARIREIGGGRSLGQAVRA
jgi:two-component system chemotaxis response regulator CheB